MAGLAVHICGLNWTVLLGASSGFSKGTGVLLDITLYPSTLTVFASLSMTYTCFINCFLSFVVWGGYLLLAISLYLDPEFPPGSFLGRPR